MADVKHIEVNGTTYDIRDDKAARKGMYIGTCSTAAGTAAKTATVDTFPLDGNGKPLVGTIVGVKFSATNTYNTAGTTMTLNVNGTGDYPIYYNNAAIVSTTSANTLCCGYKNRYIYYIYDNNGGDKWVWLTASYDANSTYSVMSQAEIDAGTGTTGRTLTPARLRDNFYTESEIDDLLDDKADTADLASVATSGSYSDLADKPTIPDELADLASDSSHRTVTDTEKATWSGKADAISVVNVNTTGNVSQALDPNKFYKFGSVDSLSLTLNAGTGFLIYAGKFTASANWTTLSVPAGVTDASGSDTVEGGKVYEFSILDNVVLVKEVG